MKVSGETPFGVPATHFGVSATESGYTLAYSADGNNYTNWTSATPANETLFVANCPKNCIYKLVGNTGDAYIQY